MVNLRERLNTLSLILEFQRGVFAVAALLIGFCSSAVAEPEAADVADLMRIDARGGKRVSLANMDLSKPGVKWRVLDSNNVEFSFAETESDPFGFHKLVLANIPLEAAEGSNRRAQSNTREIWSANGIPVKANRQYLVSALVRTDFPRDIMEFSLSLRFFDSEGNRASSRQLIGLPAKTEGPGGWQRMEWIAVVPEDPRIHEGRASIFFGWRRFETEPVVHIADMSFFELPARGLEPTAPGEGVKFPGSTGSIPMRVESVSREGDDVIVVETTGGRFEFHTQESRIRVFQRIEFPREVADWRSSLSLAGLRIIEHSDDVCVLSSPELTIGVQADSMVVFNPHSELKMTLDNRLGGGFQPLRPRASLQHR